MHGETAERPLSQPAGTLRAEGRTAVLQNGAQVLDVSRQLSKGLRLHPPVLILISIDRTIMISSIPCCC